MVTPFCISPRERAEIEDFKVNEKEREFALPWKQRNKERRDWQDSDSETGPDEQRRQKNIARGVSVQWKQLIKRRKFDKKTGY